MNSRNPGHNRGRHFRGGRGARGGGGLCRRSNRVGQHERNIEEDVHFIETSGTETSSSFTVAVQGCSHGELDSIYEALQLYRDRVLNPSDSSKSAQIDVLLCCGDVQTLRNTDDYHALAVPDKYKTMGDFHAYYSGEKVAPILTIMIGGNHEASNYLQELYYGGWVAENIYYLGSAGVVNLCKWSSDRKSISSLRIAGISGIYKSQHYRLGRFESPPYSQSELRSVYHIRQVEVERLRALAFSKVTLEGKFKTNHTNSNSNQSIDIMLSHDWPRGIEQHGNLQKLLERKPFFREEVQSNSLGSPANETLLHSLKPRYWFAAHLHVKFEAVVCHDEAKRMDDGSTDLLEGIDSTKFVGMESNEGICPDSTSVETLTDQMTRFLSLDKCLPKRRHLEILHVEPSSSRTAHCAQSNSSHQAWIEYDPEWLAVHLRTEDWIQKTHSNIHIPNDSFENEPITNQEVKRILNRLEAAASENNSDNPLALPLNFVKTVPSHDARSALQNHYCRRGRMVGNPQTDEFLKIIGMTHRITIPFCGDSLATSPKNVIDENEIDLGDDEDKRANDDFASKSAKVSHRCVNPEEIDLDGIKSEDGDAGDSVCYNPAYNVKRPRV